MFCNLFFERALSLSEISLRLFPFICVVTPNCHRTFLVFLQFLCKFRHYPLIPTCFICYHSDFPDFAVGRITPCILSVIFRRFPCFFGKKGVILSFQWFFSPESVHKLFYFHSNPCHSPRIYWDHQKKQQGSRHSMCFIYRLFHVFSFPLFSPKQQRNRIANTGGPISLL